MWYLASREVCFIRRHGANDRSLVISSTHESYTEWQINIVIAKRNRPNGKYPYGTESRRREFSRQHEHIEPVLLKKDSRTFLIKAFSITRELALGGAQVCHGSYKVPCRAPPTLALWNTTKQYCQHLKQFTFTALLQRSTQKLSYKVLRPDTGSSQLHASKKKSDKIGRST
jgi:hypothetical protein